MNQRKKLTPTQSVEQIAKMLDEMDEAGMLTLKSGRMTPLEKGTDVEQGRSEQGLVAVRPCWAALAGGT